MTDTTQNRHAWVDLAKGISIILVVMMHSVWGVGEATERVGFMHYVVAFASPFRMPEFFLISGLFLSAVIARPWRHFADRRAVHYLYFYVLWAVLLILFKHLLVDRDVEGTIAQLVSATFQPYSILWFIFALAVFSLMCKALYQLRAPHWLVLAVSAGFSLAALDTPVSIINFTLDYFVFFYAGYALAPSIFRFAQAVADRPRIAVASLLAWAIINAALIFAPGYELNYGTMTSGIAHIFGLSFILAIAGAMAVCALSVLLSGLRGIDWLRWIGAHSIVIYLSFVIPMGSFRTILLALMPNIDAGLASLATLIVSIVSPIILYWIIGKTGWGKFLFERPSWAHLPGAPGSRWGVRSAPVPAE